MPQTLDEISLRSEEVQEVLDAPPGWLVRWGISVFFLLLLMLLAIAYLVRYPDVVTGEVMLTTQHPPVKVVANSSGKLTKLHHIEGEPLHAQEVIAEVENPITTSGIAYLETLADQVASFLDNPRVPVSFSDSSYVFGSIQGEYNTLKKRCIDYHRWATDPYPWRQIKKLTAKIEQYDQLVDVTHRQTQLAQGELAHAEEKYRTDQTLFAEGVLAKLQFYREETAFRQQQQEVENYKKLATQNRITLIDLEKQLLDLRHEQAEQERNFRADIALNLHAIRNQIDTWQTSYLITAPVAGTLSYLQPLSDQQFVQTGDLLFAVVPDHETYLGIATVPAEGFGKVAVGQSVRMKFSNFPFQEYGQVPGTVRAIALLADENTYRVEITLPHGLTTSYNQPLDFTPEMMGTAEIITEDLSLLERMFYSFRSLLDR